MKREGWFWKIIAPTGAIIPYSHEYDAGYGINQHDACIKLRIGQKCFDGIGIKACALGGRTQKQSCDSEHKKKKPVSVQLLLLKLAESRKKNNRSFSYHRFSIRFRVW